MLRSRKLTLFAVLMLLLACGTWFASEADACAEARCTVRCHGGTTETCGVGSVGIDWCDCFTTSSGACHAQCDGSPSPSKFCSF